MVKKGERTQKPPKDSTPSNDAAGGESAAGGKSDKDDQARPDALNGSGNALNGGGKGTHLADAPTKPAPGQPPRQAAPAEVATVPPPPPPALNSGAAPSALSLQSNMQVNVGMRDELGKDLVVQVGRLANETVESNKRTAVALESFTHSLSEMSSTNSTLVLALQASQDKAADLTQQLHDMETAQLKKQLAEAQSKNDSGLSALQEQVQILMGSSAGASSQGSSGSKAPKAPKAATKRQQPAPQKQLMSKTQAKAGSSAGASLQGSSSSIGKARAAPGASRRKHAMLPGPGSFRALEEKDVVLISSSKGSALKPFPGAKFINRELGEKQVLSATHHNRLIGRSLFCARIEGTRANWFPGMS